MVDEAFKTIIAQGILGALLVVAIVALYFLYKSLRDTEAARIADAAKTLEMVLKVQSSVIDAVHKLGEIVEWAEKREDRREVENRK